MDDKVKNFINWIDEEINLREKEYDSLCRKGASTSSTLEGIDLLNNVRKVVQDIWEVE